MRMMKKMKTKTIDVEGFVVVQPRPPQYDEYTVIPYAFGKTASEAWYRFADLAQYGPDASKIIQAWHDRGYRIKKAVMHVSLTEDEK